MRGLTFAKAQKSDLIHIVELLVNDDLGKMRESLDEKEFVLYEKAFEEIDRDKNQFLTVGKIGEEIVATCHLTVLPSLTFMGASRLQIEGVRVKDEFRGQKIGEKMIDFVKDFARENGCKIIQLTTAKTREDALRFYERQGFEVTHFGLKFEV